MRTRPAAPPPRRRPGRPLLIAGAAVLAVTAVTGGVVAAVTAGGESGPAASDPPRGQVTTITEESRLAPLRRVVPPDVLAVSSGAPIEQERIDRLGRNRAVREVITVAGGAVQLQGRSVNALAVDPSAFRSWTPPGTAKKTDLWTALAEGGFVVSTGAAKDLRLHAGMPYPVVGRTSPNLTMGGTGALGLPGIDLLVGRKAGADMGLVDNVAVLVNAPGVDPAKLAEHVGRTLGQVSAVNLHEDKHQVAGDGSGRPADYMGLYREGAKRCPGLSWTVLAAIGQVESDHGRNAGVSSAGALGPMQFMPATWKSFGLDGDGDGKADIMNPYDAIPSAAKYLCDHGAAGGGQALYKAVWHYNHADWYVQKVLGLARAYQAQYG